MCTCTTSSSPAAQPQPMGLGVHQRQRLMAWAGAVPVTAAVDTPGAVFAIAPKDAPKMVLFAFARMPKALPAVRRHSTCCCCGGPRIKPLAQCTSRRSATSSRLPSGGSHRASCAKTRLKEWESRSQKGRVQRRAWAALEPPVVPQWRQEEHTGSGDGHQAFGE